MNLALSSNDRPCGARQTGPRRIGDLSISLATSLALHLLIFALFFLVVSLAVGPPLVKSETPIEVVVETPDEQAKERQQFPQVASAPPELADEEKKSNAPKAAFDRNGDGNDQKDEGGPTGSADKAEGDKAGAASAAKARRRRSCSRKAGH